MKRYLIVLLALSIAGCAAAQREAALKAQQERQARTHEALLAFTAKADQCASMRRSGELKSYAESVQCSNPALVTYFSEAGYPGDLTGLLVAARGVGAEKLDKGEITEAEFKFQVAELISRITAEAQRRALAAVNARSQAIAADAAQRQASASGAQATGALLQGLSAFQAVNSRPTVVCTTLGSMTACR